MVAATTILLPGETLAGYRVVEVIAIGGMAIVYRAEQIILRREVALKVIAAPLAEDEGFRARFRSEGRVLARLDHPNIVSIHDAGETAGRLFLAMDVIKGDTLADRMRADGVTAEQAIRWLGPVASALDAAHSAGIVHRDVKPQNILIDETEYPYLADFGIAKGDETTGIPPTRAFIGTCNYAAPEQIRGLPVTPATDVYALTALFYHCVTGQPPYAGNSDAAILHAHVFEPPPKAASGQACADRFNALIARGMAKRPQDRFESTGELMRSATELVQGLPIARQVTAPAFVAETNTLSSDDTPGNTELREHGPVAATSTPPRVAGELRQSDAERKLLWPIVQRHRLRLVIAAATALLVAAAIVTEIGSPAQPNSSLTSRSRSTINNSFAGATLNPAVWATDEQSYGTSQSVHNGSLLLTAWHASSGFHDGILTRCRAVGNFDAQIHFTLTRWPTGDDVSLAVNAPPLGNTFVEDAGGGGVYGLFVNPPTVTTTPTTVQPGSKYITIPAFGRSGELRLSRRGDMTSSYVRSGSASVWRQVGHFIGSRMPTWVGIAIWNVSGFRGQPVTVRVESFKLDAAALSC